MMNSRMDRISGIDSPWAVPLFVLLAFGWTWLWWLPLVPFDLPEGWRLALGITGASGPALAGAVVVRRWAGGRSGVGGSERRALNAWGFVIGVALATGGLLFRWFEPWDFQDAVTRIPPDTPTATLGLYGLVVVILGFTISGAFSSRPGVRSFFRGIIPDRRAWMLLGPVLLFLPALLIAADILASAFGLEYPAPRYRSEPLAAWLPPMLAALVINTLTVGGVEEYGWRGVMQPLLQRRMNPIAATLIIAVVWEAWHLPLFMEGYYGDVPWHAGLTGRLPTTIALSFVFTALYNFSRGSIFLCVVLHAAFNSQIGVFGGSPLALPVGIAVVVALVIAMRMWRRDGAFTASVPVEPAAVSSTP